MAVKDIWNPEIYQERLELGEAAAHWMGYRMKELRDRPDWARGGWMEMVDKVYVSEDLIVQETIRTFDAQERLFYALSIRRIDSGEIRESWSYIRSVMADLCRGDEWAYEIFPPEKYLSDQAPCRWLWVYPNTVEADPLGVGLHRKHLVGELRPPARI